MNSSEMFQVLTVLRTNLSMRRDVALTGIFAKLCTMELAACGSQDNFHAFFPQGAARMHTGPEVAGCRSSSNWLNSLFYIYMFKFFLSYNLSALGMFQALHCRPVVVTFSDFKDREEVRNVSVLPKSGFAKKKKYLCDQKHSTGVEKSCNAEGKQCLCDWGPFQVNVRSGFCSNT